jgi:hypothetical protein
MASAATLKGPGREEKRVPGLGLRDLEQGPPHGLQVLAHPAGEAPLLHPGPGQAPRPPALGLLLQEGDLLAGEGLGHPQGLDPFRLAEEVKGAFPEEGAHLLELQAKAEVGLVGAKALHGLLVGEAGEGEGKLHAQGLAEDVGHEAFVEGEDVLHLHEAHLQVHLGEVGLAVGPEVFIPEAAGDLEVAVKARHHQHLLEKLGGLGQGVEEAGLLTVGDQEVPGPFRGAFGEEGGLHLDEALPVQVVPDGLDDPVPEAEVFLHPPPAQVQVAVLEAELLPRLLLLLPPPAGVHGEGRGFGFGQDLQGGELHLHGPRGQAGVGLGAEAHQALGPHHPLRAHPFRHSVGGALGVGHELDHALPVPQVYEDQPAQVPAAVDPALEDHLLPRVLFPKAPGVVGAAHNPLKLTGFSS